MIPRFQPLADTLEAGAAILSIKICERYIDDVPQPLPICYAGFGTIAVEEISRAQFNPEYLTQQQWLVHRVWPEEMPTTLSAGNQYFLANRKRSPNIASEVFI
ncbi:MAG: hypothetical protein ACFB0G_05210 [Leptolyngbyaceae cyanobacterium]